MGAIVALGSFQNFAQNFDGLCVLPINILNEKIYIFMWFWFIFVAIVTSLYMIYRIMTMASASIRSSSLQVYAQLLVDKAVTNRLLHQSLKLLKDTC